VSEKNDDLDVIIEEDKKPEVVVDAKKPEGGAAAAPVRVEPDDGLDDLKTKLADERKGREQERQARLVAEQQRDAHARSAHEAKVETHDSNLALVTNAIATVKAEQDGAKVRYRDARAAGDIDAETDALAEMQTNAAKLLQLEQGKAAMEAAPKPNAPIVAPSDPVEALASQLTPRSAAWVRSHPEYARDTRLYQRMLAAHNLAVTDGLDVDTDEYFAAVEDTLKVRQPTRRDDEGDEDDPLAAAATVTRRRESPPPAAPPSGGGSDLNGRRTNVVRLTSEEREIAKLNGMTDQEYARNKLALQKEGKLH
jgi:hypothetical protein